MDGALSAERTPTNPPAPTRLVPLTPTEIRATHPYAFRSGRWAKLIGFDFHDGRDCFIVKFPDGATDLWPTDDPDAGYERRHA